MFDIDPPADGWDGATKVSKMLVLLSKELPFTSLSGILPLCTVFRYTGAETTTRVPANATLGSIVNAGGKVELQVRQPAKGGGGGGGGGSGGGGAAAGTLIQ